MSKPKLSADERRILMWICSGDIREPDDFEQVAASLVRRRILRLDGLGYAVTDRGWDMHRELEATSE